MLVGLKRISTALGLLAATAAASQAQSVINSPNQATADAVAGALRASRALSGYRIEIETRDGIVTLTGTLATPAQKAEAVGRAQRVSGVAGVVDRLSLAGDSRVQNVQYQPMPNGAPGPGGGGVIYDPSAAGVQPGFNPSAAGVQPGYDPSAAGMQPGTISGCPVPEGPAGGAGGVGGAGGGTAMGGHGMPNYAWPSYAPYPNFSAVGYPTAYPWQAWPNIAPPYPYPEVPLDWRAVTLRWDDGIWWLDFKKHYTRPFFTPYPFGIFAY